MQGLRRNLVAGSLLLAILGVLAWLLWPAAVPVNATAARIAPFTEYVEDEGRTALRHAYVISAPIAGFLRRVELDVGDRVDRGDVLFRLEPLPTPALDQRSREQARAAVAGARARLKTGQAQLESRQAERKLAESEYQRKRKLHERDFVADAALSEAESRLEAARAAERAARHAAAEARHALASAELTLSVADGSRVGANAEPLPVRAPIAGTVVERHRCCEGAISPGAPVLEMGDLSDLEVVVDLLSMDAVRVKEGMPVVLDRWGGDRPLRGRVRRVEPAGFKRVSALGVDEQRVTVRVDLESPRSDWSSLGHGYRVEARFILWQADAVLQVPTSALFRADGDWALFAVADGRARLRRVAAGRQSGLWTQIEDGLSEGEIVVTHPGDRVVDGVRVDADVRSYEVR